MTFKPLGTDFVEDFELCPLRSAAGAEVVFLLECGFDGVDGVVVVDEVVIAMDGAGRVLLDLLSLLAGGESVKMGR